MPKWSEAEAHMTRMAHLLHGWDSLKRHAFHSLLTLSTRKHVKCYPAMTELRRACKVFRVLGHEYALLHSVPFGGSVSGCEEWRRRNPTASVERDHPPKGITKRVEQQLLLQTGTALCQGFVFIPIAIGSIVVPFSVVHI